MIENYYFPGIKGDSSMAYSIVDGVLVREFDDGRDIEMVGKLEKNCEIGSNNNKGTSIFTNNMGDPLCRIRFFPLRLMLVAEMQENGELVGVIRGCIKHVGTKFGRTNLKLGCILGLRVSPTHRRMGIGLKLVRSMEEWLIDNGAHYNFLATEKNNVASINLFTTKCNYTNLSSLAIFVQPISHSMEGLSQDIKVEKLNINQAITLYNNKLKGKDLYLTDVDAILKERLSLGTWVSYFEQDEWICLHGKGKDEDIITTIPPSWAMFSIWNSCEAYKIDHIKKPNFFHEILSHARDKMFPCLKNFIPMCDYSVEKPFGYLFLYGIHGEGDRLGELMKSVWSFALRLGEDIKDCKMIITELGVNDPVVEHVPHGSTQSRIDDLWYFKKVNGSINDEDELGMMGELGNVVVDPRDF